MGTFIYLSSPLRKSRPKYLREENDKNSRVGACVRNVLDTQCKLRLSQKYISNFTIISTHKIFTRERYEFHISVITYFSLNLWLPWKPAFWFS